MRSTAAVLQITGRDLLETPELAMQFQDGFWTARGDAATTVLNTTHQAIIETLRTAGYPDAPTQLATVLNVNLSTMKVHLMRLTDRGLVGKTGQGQYVPRIVTPEGPSRVAHETVAPSGPEDQPHDIPEALTLDPTPPEERAERSTPLMFTPTDTEGPEEVGDTAPDEVTVTTVTRNVPPPIQSQHSTNGHTNGHYNGAASYTLPSTIDPVCPQCARPACQPYGATGRVCMRCGYCERPGGVR
jgi:hypothetical protein